MSGDFNPLHDLARKHGSLAGSAVRFRKGVVTDDDPLSVALGGSDIALTGLRVANGARPRVGDIVAVLSWGNDRLVLGTIGDGRPQWQTPTFESGWSRWDLSGYPVGYMREPSGLVRLRGLVKKATAPRAFETMFVLPAGFRPGQVTVHGGLYNDASCGVSVVPDGRVLIRVPPAPTAGGWQSLDDASYMAEG